MVSLPCSHDYYSMTTAHLVFAKEDKVSSDIDQIRFQTNFSVS